MGGGGVTYGKGYLTEMKPGAAPSRCNGESGTVRTC